MWDQVKAAVMDVLSRHRATVTHHHAVGRDHRRATTASGPIPCGGVAGARQRWIRPVCSNPGSWVPIDPEP